MQAVDDGPMDLEMQLLSPPTADNGTRNIMRTAILALQPAQMFLAAPNHASPPVSRVSSSKTTTYETERSCEEMVVEFDQSVPLLIKTSADSALNSRKQIRKVINVVRSTLAFKAHANYVHRRTCETQRNLEVAEACDSSSDQHPITINQLQGSQTKNISNIVRHKDLQTLQDFGGLSGVAHALGTNLVNGISGNEALCRTQEHAFSPTLDRHAFLHFVWNERKNKTILFLSLVVVLSLVFGIDEEGVKDGSRDGLVVFVAIILLVLFASIRNYRQETIARKKLRKLQSTNMRMAEVHVVRGGIQSYICESKLVCGDVVILNKSCQVPCDGLFVNGQTLELDCGSESCLINEQNPFLSYGERVINGDARMLVTSVTMMRKATCDPDTRFKLETHLDKLNTWMHYIGLIISIIVTIVLFIRYIAGKMDDENGYKLESIGKPTSMSNLANIYKKIIKESKYSMRGLTKLLSVSLVGVTEGVPFVVSLAIYYWNDETLFGKAVEQDSQSVLKMASVTRICTDIFGDFSEDEIEVEKLFIGEVISGCSNISPNVVEALCDGIGTLKERKVFYWAKDKLGFKTERMVENMDLHLNGQMEEILSKCTHYYTRKGEKSPINDVVRSHFDQVNKTMQHKHLRTLAFACKHTHDTQTLDANDMVFVALLGLKSKSKEATKAQIKVYKDCKIETVIVSSKSISVLEDIAFQYEVITNVDTKSLVITGEVFRKYTDNERLEKADKIRVLGEALASDKLLLVETLRKKGEVVVFLGQRTDDAPTLKEADIGIAMGTWSSIKARESCDIIMWDGSFVDLVNMVDSGKCIYHNIQSFVYLVLTTTISSTLLNLVETIALGDVSLSIIQLIWVNLAMDFLGGLALLTKPSLDKPVSMDPISCETSFITVQMIINIVFQVSYQGICLAIVQLEGSRIAGTSEHTKTVVFNIFIFCQFFNQFNARELQKKNFFRGVNRHIQFWVSIGLFIVLHALFIVVQELTGYGKRMGWKLWAGCVVVGAGSWPVNWIGKCISRSIKIIVGKLCDIWLITS